MVGVMTDRHPAHWLQAKTLLRDVQAASSAEAKWPRRWQRNTTAHWLPLLDRLGIMNCCAGDPRPGYELKMTFDAGLSPDFQKRLPERRDLIVADARRMFACCKLYRG